MLKKIRRSTRLFYIFLAGFGSMLAAGLAILLRYGLLIILFWIGAPAIMVAVIYKFFQLGQTLMVEKEQYFQPLISKKEKGKTYAVYQHSTGRKK
jgi:uncharacterized protein (DUF2062 family)